MQFEVDDNYIKKFEKKIVGSSEHEEYWIPAKELEQFNSNIIGAIEPVSAAFGEKFDKLHFQNHPELKTLQK